MDNVILNKISSIERCLSRVKEEYKAAGKHFIDDYTRQDAAILNLLRACEQCIDLANYIVKREKLGLTQSSRASFELLVKNKLISPNIGKALKGMVGFRNIAVHNYTDVDLKVVQVIIKKHLKDIEVYCQEIMKLS